MYASFLGISEALHLGILKQPLETGLLDRRFKEVFGRSAFKSRAEISQGRALLQAFGSAFQFADVPQGRRRHVSISALEKGVPCPFGIGGNQRS
jgi:hypothetical protein